VQRTIGNNAVTALWFSARGVTRLGPICALRGLRQLACTGTKSERSPLADLAPLAGLTLTNLSCAYAQVNDLAALKGMPLTKLNCAGNPIGDLSPLKGMPLESLNCGDTLVRDLSPLRGMSLHNLTCYLAPVSDLDPLRGMPLSSISVFGTKVTDLSPLKDSPLTELRLDFNPQRDTTVLRSIKTLQEVNGWPIEEFWNQVAKGIVPTHRFKAPESARTVSPAGEAFVKEVTALPAEEQVARVVAKLKELNPGYDGRENHRIEKGQVVQLGLTPTQIADISPLRALTNLRQLFCGVLGDKRISRLADLTPLKGLPLEQLRCPGTDVSDLSPLQGMPLKFLGFNYTRVTDLSALKGMPLEKLHFKGTQVSDLSPLRGTPLSVLECQETPVRDLSPLRDAPLEDLKCDPAVAASPGNRKVLRSIKTLKQINGITPAEFWKLADQGQAPQAPAQNE
jgi:Leucine-rich repeat (LRR) protein